MESLWLHKSKRQNQQHFEQKWNHPHQQRMENEWSWWCPRGQNLCSRKNPFNNATKPQQKEKQKQEKRQLWDERKKVMKHKSKIINIQVWRKEPPSTSDHIHNSWAWTKEQREEVTKMEKHEMGMHCCFWGLRWHNRWCSRDESGKRERRENRERNVPWATFNVS